MANNPLYVVEGRILAMTNPCLLLAIKVCDEPGKYHQSIESFNNTNQERVNEMRSKLSSEIDGDVLEGITDGMEQFA